jgi:hypothetical protein
VRKYSDFFRGGSGFSVGCSTASLPGLAGQWHMSVALLSVIVVRFFCVFRPNQASAAQTFIYFHANDHKRWYR